MERQPEPQYRMLLKNGQGQPLPWTAGLASRLDMKEVMMTAAEISAAVSPHEKARGTEPPPPVKKPRMLTMQEKQKRAQRKRELLKHRADKRKQRKTAKILEMKNDLSGHSELCAESGS